MKIKAAGNKLAPNYTGPYVIVKRMGEVDYKVEKSPWPVLKTEVFHISRLKKYISPLRVAPRPVETRADSGSSDAEESSDGGGVDVAFGGSQTERVGQDFPERDVSVADSLESDVAEPVQPPQLIGGGAEVGVDAGIDDSIFEDESILEAAGPRDVTYNPSDYTKKQAKAVRRSGVYTRTRSNVS